MAQMAERSLPTPEIRGSNPDIVNISNIFICQLLSRKDENKEKEAGNGPLKKRVQGTPVGNKNTKITPTGLVVGGASEVAFASAATFLASASPSSLFLAGASSLGFNGDTSAALGDTILASASNEFERTT